MFRFGWMGLAVVLAAFLWNFWMPSVFSLKVGLLAFFTLLFWIPQDRWASVILICMMFLLGSLRISSISLNPVEKDVYHSIAWVKGKVGQKWLLEGKNERWWAQIPKNMDLQLGELIALKHHPQRHFLALPNGILPKYQQERGRVTSTKISSLEKVIDVAPMSKPPQFISLSQGDILWALVSGQKQLDKETKILLQNTGTSHLLAISGMHIALLAGLVFWLLKGLLFWMEWGQCNLRLPLLGAMGAGIYYGQLVGWPASAQRAVLMLLLFSVGRWWELDFSLWDVLGAAAGVLLLKEPMWVNDLGFQLSFSAVMGIAYFLPMIQRSIQDFSKSIRWLLLSIGVSFGATMGTLPLCGLVFQQVPWVGLFSNIFVGPLVGGIATPLAMLGFLTDGWLAQKSLYIANSSIEWALWILRLFDIAPLPIAWSVEVAWLVGVVILMVHYGRWWWRTLNGFCLIGLVLWHSPYWEHHPHFFEVHFLDVGQGDGTLLRWSDGEDWLIDGGPYSWEVGSYLKRLGIWKLQKVVISHAHPDHYAVLHQVLEQVEVESILIGRWPNKDEVDYANLITKALDKGIRIELLGKDFTGDPTHQVTVWHPQQNWKSQSSDWVNEESIVLEVEHGQHSWLFTGDIEKEAEELLISKMHKVDVLKVAHHGSKTSSMKELLQVLDPNVAVIQCGDQNRFGHPHPQTLWTLRERQVLQNNQVGTIIMTSDGKHMNIDTQMDVVNAF